MKCPNCDFIDKDEAFGDPATCPKCGVIYEKALRVQQLKKKLEAQKAEKAARQETSAKKESWLAKGLKGAADEVKSSRARCSNAGAQTLYTKDGTPVLVSADKKGGGCLRPLAVLGAVLLLIGLFSEAKKSYQDIRAGASSSVSSSKSKRTERELETSVRYRAERIIKIGLKDPDSARFRNQKGRCGEVNAKNSFGAYNGFKRYTVVNSELFFIDDGSRDFEELWIRSCF